MKRALVNENQRGFLFKNGRYAKLLKPGKYFFFGDCEVEFSLLDREISPRNCLIDTLLGDRNFANDTDMAEVSDTQLCLHFVDGKFREVLESGRHVFWKAAGKHEFILTDISTPEVAEDIPRYILTMIPSRLYRKIEVAEYQKARLFFDKKFVRLLEAGTYYFWNNQTAVEADLIDTRLTMADISGQEIMTQDKVAVRINFVCSYRVTDYVKVLTEIDDYQEQLHVTVQLALRDYVGKTKLDDLLASKDEMSRYVLEKLKQKEKELYISIDDAGVKDIILPGEIRDIMNTVLIAEKRAQANVITRREEVASTRSLLNTAKLMDENRTLYKLKEMEYVERICENVGNISLNGSGDILGQLTAILDRREEAE